MRGPVFAVLHTVCDRQSYLWCGGESKACHLSNLGALLTSQKILLHSIEKVYFLKNLPWLIGSLGTLAEDAIIFYQFHKYGDSQSVVE